MSFHEETVHDPSKLTNGKHTVEVIGRCHGVALQDPGSITIDHVTVDCARQHGKGVHGFRVSGNVDGLIIKRLHVFAAQWYGVGLQRIHGHMTIEELVIHGAGADGLDVKWDPRDSVQKLSIGHAWITNCRRGLDIRGTLDVEHLVTARCKVGVHLHRRGEGGYSGILRAGDFTSVECRKPVDITGRHKTERVTVSGVHEVVKR